MSEPQACKTVVVVNPQGLHARPADLFVRLANQFVAVIRVKKGNEAVDGKSILSILTLAAAEGSELQISAVGADAEAAVAALGTLVEQGFSADEAASHTEASP